MKCRTNYASASTLLVPPNAAVGRADGTLVEEAQDIAWVVHRASLYSDGPTKGTLARSQIRLSVARFVDCAAYKLRLLADETAVHTCDLSFYVKVPARIN